ncbi:drug/metabolite transporter (DMT)-like permease [Actinoplanes octamycinicus]|uniref:Drug/metabolite transporter (DMT)-like permease n=1 Tax=Actinoplanes octamycinicus TaxID=135948 RepID=A0A7W7H3Q5_9ACTN|nr:DMT family transporter [Actinoplanes octamycinicus]MBB4743425.1 drug/metabolite transporter (DMT)-like permease [Actinoplanes octamycinicus]GIE63421.1 membrane protein [Actinoplanes octamycinicus]
MSTGIVVAVLFAAVLHAAWNAIAHAIPDRLIGFVLIQVAGAVIAVPMVLATPLPAAGSWPWLLLSVAVHVVYLVLLMRGYRLGHFSQVYPLTRGASPLLVAGGAALLIGEVPGPVQLLGVVIISVGLGILVFAGGVPGRAQLPSITAALLTGVSIAAYTTIDGIGVRAAGTTAGYAGWLFLLMGPAIPLVALAMRGRKLLAQLRPHRTLGLTGGLLSVGAYGLVLWAQTRGALAPVAALRESSVVIAAVIGVVRFGEPFGRWRIISSILVAAGVVLVSV